LRSRSFDLPSSRSKVHFTSADENGLPSWKVTPSRSLSTNRVPVSSQAQLVASSGTIESMDWMGFCWSNSIRLLKMPIAAICTETVDSSWIDSEAGLSRCWILSVPPDFCA
jgi:hypothetical protein